MITGPYRIPLVEFLKEQATESLLHAQQAGEILTGLGGHPTQEIAQISESHQHSIYDILSESFDHESAELSLYRELLEVAQDASVYIEEYARDLIGQEELHSLELKKCSEISNWWMISPENKNLGTNLGFLLCLGFSQDNY